MAEFKAKGGFVHELTPAQRAEWAKLVEPNQEQMVKEIGGQLGRAVGRHPEGQAGVRRTRRQVERRPASPHVIRSTLARALAAVLRDDPWSGTSC